LRGQKKQVKSFGGQVNEVTEKWDFIALCTHPKSRRGAKKRKVVAEKVVWLVSQGQPGTEGSKKDYQGEKKKPAKNNPTKGRTPHYQGGLMAYNNGPPSTSIQWKTLVKFIGTKVGHVQVTVGAVWPSNTRQNYSLNETRVWENGNWSKT